MMPPYLMPAEVAYIYNASTYSSSDFLKFSLQGLLYKYYYYLKTVAAPGQPGVVHLMAGPNYGKLELTPYERPWHHDFAKPAEGIALKDLVWLVLETHKDVKFGDELIRPFLLQQALLEEKSARFLFFKTTKYVLSETGREFNLFLSGQLSPSQRDFKKWVDSAPAQALETLAELGPNIVLVKGVNRANLKKLNKAARHSRKKYDLDWAALLRCIDPRVVAVWPSVVNNSSSTEIEISSSDDNNSDGDWTWSWSSDNGSAGGSWDSNSSATDNGSAGGNW